MTTQMANILIKNMSNISKNYISYSLLEKYTLCCHDLAKWLSHYLFLFLFLFLFLSWTYYIEESAGKCYITSVTQSQSHDRKSQHHIT